MILSQYNDIYNKAIEVFGQPSVTIDEDSGEIKIKTGNICLLLLCSSNEYKVYIHSYDIPKEIKKKEGDLYFKINKECGLNVRLMDRESIISYLYIKKTEHDFLNNNGG